jgi:putative tryptophan/tyrosine transport system substrate-binding protein
MPVIGLLMLSASESHPIFVAMRKGLRDLGYVEGRDFRIEHRGAKGQLDRLSGLAGELVGLKVDVIVTGTDEGTHAARQATSTIPIVAGLFDQDPVAAGFVGSFNRPGGNITGVYTHNAELGNKRLELLKEALPHLVRVAVFWDSAGRADLPLLMRAAQSLGIQLQFLELRAPSDFTTVFRIAKKQGAGAVIVVPSPELYINGGRLGALALANGLPLIGESRNATDAGGLMSYSSEPEDAFYRAAYFIGRLLRGANAGELPIEVSESVKLVVNLKTAKALGLTIPHSVLVHADEIIR